MMQAKTYQLLRLAGLLCLLLFCQAGYSQLRTDSLFAKLDPVRFADAVKKKAAKLEEKLLQKSIKTLDKMQQQEEKLYGKILNGKDSLLAKTRLAGLKEKYAALKDNIKNPAALSKARQYIPRLDSVNTALKFLDANGMGEKAKEALAKTEMLKSKFQQAEDIKKFLRERREQLKKYFENIGAVKQLKQVNKQVYYYAAQVKEYKEILNDPSKIEKKALELLAKTKWFQEFFRKNSMLASLFRMPNPDEPLSMASLGGLQTRAQVSAQIQQIISSGGPNGAQQFQQNMQAAQDQLSQMKNNMLKKLSGIYGPVSSDDIMPEGFKPNTEKTKSFLQRLEYGANMQSQKGNGFWPNNTDLGLSVGYKLNPKSLIGFGASYKLGLGRGLNAIKLSSEGIGLRSFIDWKVKKMFWVSGGFEMNYRSAFTSLDQLQNYAAWQHSGLIGISRNIPVKSKVLSKTKLQLLWDFLSYEQVPKTQPLIIRIGYSFK